ncbi:TetR family transcriptional regulator [Escherichia coli]|uniref:TetR family transcriptional regulator n=1 Tax=Escherichia coli TaxID=562 RepID=A0A377D077_ECOLX|nr:TetR family transcriptional regulator [Escherichia coli]
MQRFDKAMKLFWQHGYEATSLADLVEATGAKAPHAIRGIYQQRGVIFALFSTAISIVLPLSMKHSCFVKRKAWSLRWLTILLPSANCFTSKDTPAGCFMINNCTTLSPDSGDIGNTLKSRHAMQERTLQQFLCQRQARGEIPTHCDVTHLAEFLNCIIQGMSISAREGASLEKLMQIVRTTLRLWPELVK